MRKYIMNPGIQLAINLTETRLFDFSLALLKAEKYQMKLKKRHYNKLIRDNN